jgi:hypothetical protein
MIAICNHNSTPFWHLLFARNGSNHNQTQPVIFGCAGSICYYWMRYLDISFYNTLLYDSTMVNGDVEKQI